jgi:uncharacterized membrane protein YbhN (UPF0104 family)
MEPIFSPEENRELIRGWLIHARKGWKKHEKASRRIESQYQIIGVASVVLSAFVGGSIFTWLEAANDPWGKIVVGLFSFFAAALAGLITFQRFEERAEKHRSAGVNYKAALRNLEKIHSLPDGSKLDQEVINRIQEIFDQLEKLAPVVPENINRAVEKQYQCYRFESKAEDLCPGREY